jgi:hypothetical protein
MLFIQQSARSRPAVFCPAVCNRHNLEIRQRIWEDLPMEKALVEAEVMVEGSENVLNQTLLLVMGCLAIFP